MEERIWITKLISSMQAAQKEGTEVVIHLINGRTVTGKILWAPDNPDEGLTMEGTHKSQREPYRRSMNIKIDSIIAWEA